MLRRIRSVTPVWSGECTNVEAAAAVVVQKPRQQVDNTHVGKYSSNLKSSSGCTAVRKSIVDKRTNVVISHEQ